MIGKNKIVNLVVFGIQLVAGLFLANAAYNSFILPDSYKYIVYIVVVILAILSTFLLMKIKTNKILNALRVVFIAVLAVALISGSILIPEIEAAVSKLQVGQPTEGKVVIDIIALADTEYNSEKDFLSDAVAVQTNLDQENQNYAISYINLEIDGEMLISDYEDYESALRDLQSGAIKYLMINESFISVLNETEEFENFTENVKVVYQVSKTVAYDNIESDVQVTENPFNVLILGQNQEGVTVSDTVLTDVVMVATVNPITKQILLTSLPRDSYVDVSYSGVDDKLTHTGIYGTQTVIETVENVLDIDIDFYLRINYNSFVRMVDALGGITVDNEYEFPGVFPDYQYTFKEGTINLDGDMALAYARERKATKCGDISRNKHQRQVLSAIIDKVASPSILTKFNDILTSLDGTYLTNITSNQIYSLIKMQLTDLASWNIESYGITGSTGSAYVASASQSQKYSVVFIDDDSLAGAKTAIADVYNATAEETTDENTTSYRDGDNLDSIIDALFMEVQATSNTSGNNVDDPSDGC